MRFAIVLDKSDSAPWLLSWLLGLQFSQGGADGIELLTSAFVDVILVMKNVFDI